MPFIAFAVVMGITIGMMAVNWYMHRNDPKPPLPKPEGLQFAQGEIGTAIPYVYGTIRMDHPLIAWHGNHEIRADNGVIPGLYTYSMDMLLILGIPSWDDPAPPYSNHSATGSSSARRLRRIIFGDIVSDVLTAAATFGLAHEETTYVSIDLGGLGAGGRFNAHVQFHDGRRDQIICTYPSDGISSPTSRIDQAFVKAGNIQRQLVPGYRNQMLVAVTMSSTTSYDNWGDLNDNLDDNNNFDNIPGTAGESARVASIGFEVRTLGPQPCTDGGTNADANPAWVIYDLLCSPVWKLGFAPSQVDLASFEAAADTLQGEVNGCSLVIYEQEDAPQVVGHLLAQIDGVLFEDPHSGTIKIKLIRNDYDVEDIEELTPDNTVGRPEVQWLHWRGSANQIRLFYTNRGRSYKQDSVIAQRLANAVGQDNQLRTKEMRFPYCCNNVQATKLAARELSMISRPMMFVNVKVTRAFYASLPGDAVLCNWPQHNITDKVFRILQIDLGQPADMAITLSLVEDVFDASTGGFEAPPVAVVGENLIPLPERYFEEAPYHLLERLTYIGAMPIGLLNQQVMSLCVVDGDAIQYRTDTIKVPASFGLYSTTPGSDVPQQFFPTTATVAEEYSRTKDPYDQGVGYMLIENVSSDFVGQVLPAALGTASPTETEENLKNVILVCESEPGTEAMGNGEFMAFTRIEDVGGGQYKLFNPWRGLMDTTPRTWPVGSRVYWLKDTHTGRRSYLTGETSLGYATPLNGLLVGSGEEHSDSQLIALRKNRPMPLASIAASGYELAGTQGTPPATETYPLLGRFKEITDLDGDVRLYGNERSITAGRIVRGDSTAYAAETGVVWDLYGQKMDGVDALEDEAAILDKQGLANFGAGAQTGILLGNIGHGAIDLICHSKNASGVRSWQSPAIRVAAHRYRNLLANGLFDYNSLTPGWTVAAGSFTVETGANSLSNETARHWVESAADTSTLTQTVDVRGYKPVGLTALVTFYARTFDGGEVPRGITVTIAALDASDVEISSSVSGSLTGPITSWRRHTFSFAMPAGTVKIKVSMAFANLDTGASNISLQLGQMGSQLLTNPSFDGNLTGWTAVGTALVLDATVPYASDDGANEGAARGGSASVSEVKQEVSAPVGYRHSTAVVTYAQTHMTATGTAGDVGEVRLEALDWGGAVIGQATLGGESLSTSSPDVWARRRIALDLPDGTITLRLRLMTIRAGASTCGAAFDDLALRCHNHLDPTSTLDLNFGAPARTGADPGWQRFHLQRPTISIPVIWGGNLVAPSHQLSAEVAGATHAWSDGATHTSGRFICHHINAGENAISMDAYVFTRQPAASAVDLQSLDGDATAYGKVDEDDVLIMAVLLRTDEMGAWQGACGIAGRRGDTGIGWGLGIDATGHAKATVQGDAGAVSATSADVINDGAPHWVVIKHEGGNVKVFTRGGTVSAGTGSIGDMTISGIPLRIGRDGPASQTLPGMIARAYLWQFTVSDAALEALVAELHADPSGELTSFTADQAVYVPGPEIANANFGVTLVRRAANTPHVCYDADMDADGDGYALAVTATQLNYWPSNDTTDLSRWAFEAGSSLVRTQQDPTGLDRGVRCTVATAGNGLRITDIVMTSNIRVVAQVWLRADTARSITVELLNGADAVKGTSTLSVTTTWQRYVCEYTAWDNSTPTGHLRIRLQSGTGYFDCCHVGCITVGNATTDAPFVVQDAGVTLGDCHGQVDVTFPKAQNYRGEIYVEGRCLVTNPVRGRYICNTDNNTNVNNSRLVSIETVPEAVNFTLQTSTGSAPNNTEADVTAWNTLWKVRCRWNSVELPEEPGAGQHGVVLSNGNFSYEVFDFIPDETPQTHLRIGGAPAGPLGTNSTCALLRRVRVSADEPKMDAS